MARSKVTAKDKSVPINVIRTTRNGMPYQRGDRDARAICSFAANCGAYTGPRTRIRNSRETVRQLFGDARPARKERAAGNRARGDRNNRHQGKATAGK